MPFHGPDLIIIVVIALLIFGPKRLPEMGGAVGKSIKEFKKGMAELTGRGDKEEKEEEPKSPSQMSLEEIERELASRKAALKATEASQPEVEVSNSETKVD